MKVTRRPGQPSEEQKRQARKKENNPFDEQEKHGSGAQGRTPGTAEEYQGRPSVQPHAAEVTENTPKK